MSEKALEFIEGRFPILLLLLILFLLVELSIRSWSLFVIIKGPIDAAQNGELKTSGIREYTEIDAGGATSETGYSHSATESEEKTEEVKP